MATIAIPCEPRVLVNGTKIAQSLLDSVAAESRNDHDIWLLLPYRAKAAAEPMLNLLRNQFRNLKTIELYSPVVGSYALVTSMFARLQQVLTCEGTSDERAIIWVSERGNELFKEGAIDALDATFWRKKCDTVGLKTFTIPATDRKSESVTLDGTFVMSSQLYKKYPQRVPYVTISEHFRIFLDSVLTEKCHMLDVKDFIDIGAVPNTEDYRLPQYQGETVVTTPAEVSIASFRARGPETLGTDEQVGGAKLVQTREDFSTETTEAKKTKAKKTTKSTKTEEESIEDVVKPEEDPESEYV